MKQIAPLSLVFSIAILAFSSPAAAVPVRASFNGVVSGGTAFATDLLNEFPAGTSASFDVMFDDSGLVAFGPTDFDLAPVSGTVRLGGLEWSLNAGHVMSYSFQGPAFEVIRYGLQLTGTGPLIADGDSLFGLFLGITPALDFDSINPFQVGFRSPFPGGESYGYATLTGTASIARVSVAEPGTLFLASAAFALLWVRRKRSSGASA